MTLALDFELPPHTIKLVPSRPAFSVEFSSWKAVSQASRAVKNHGKHWSEQCGEFDHACFFSEVLDL